MKYLFYNLGAKRVKYFCKERSIKPEDVIVITFLKNKKGYNAEYCVIDGTTKLKYHKIKTRTWLQKWANKKFNNKTVKELFSYNNQTLFYLWEYLAERERFMFKGRVAFNYVFTILDILSEYIKEDVSVVSRDEHGGIFIKILEKYCKYNKHKLKIVDDSAFSPHFFWQITGNKQIVKNLIQTRIWARYLMGQFRKFFSSYDKRFVDVIFLSNIRWATKKDEDNLMFGTIKKELKSNKISSKILMYDPLDNQNTLWAMIRTYLFYPASYLGDYYSLKIIQKIDNLSAECNKIWNEIKKDKSFQNSFGYNRLNVYDVVEPMLDLIFGALIHVVSDSTIIAEEILKKEKPKLFVLDHEDSFYGRGLLMAAKNSNIKSIALEHDVIVREDVNLSHIKDKHALHKKSVMWRPLADKKCVWASFSKNVLLEMCNYTPNLIEITGNPKFDKLFTINKDKEELLKKYAFPKNKQIILYAAQNNINDAMLFLDTAKKMPEYNFLIKPSPGCKFDLFKTLIPKYKTNNIFFLSKNANTYELLCISDLLVTKTSTVGIESLILGVPVIILNPDNDCDAWGYLKNHAALEAKDSQELKEKINYVVKKDTSTLKKNVQKFVHLRAYEQDGRAAERVVNVIKSLL